jgi:hypothetical protein
MPDEIPGVHLVPGATSCTAAHSPSTHCWNEVPWQLNWPAVQVPDAPPVGTGTAVELEGAAGGSMAAGADGVADGWTDAVGAMVDAGTKTPPLPSGAVPAAGGLATAELEGAEADGAEADGAGADGAEADGAEADGAGAGGAEADPPEPEPEPELEPDPPLAQLPSREPELS